MKKVCKSCVMDTTDSEITFNEIGICNYCSKYKKYFDEFDIDQKKIDLGNILKKVKQKGVNNEYDCILGLSGGIDSSYLALKCYDWGLKPLVVHVDAGWNSELAVYNIEKIIKHCNYELHTEVINWQDMRNLQLSFLESGICNQDVPQDHIFFASLYHFAIKNKIKYILSGGNLSTECIFPESWQGSAMDSINLKAIHKKFGKSKLQDYKTISFFKYYLLYPFYYGMRTIRPLNFINYNKDYALNKLKKIGYKQYEKKHEESIFTKFFQQYYMPKKFGYDIRKPHLSSLIVSNQISRDKAMDLLKKPLYSKDEMERLLTYISKKLEVDQNKLIDLINNKNRKFSEFPNWVKYQKIIFFINKVYKFITGQKISIYS